MIIRGPTMIEMLMTAEPSMVPPKITERAVVDYPTIAQHHSPVNEVAEWPDIVQHHQHGGACRQKLGQHLCKHPLMLEVNPRRGLIQHQKVWLTSQGARHQDSLLLAAGEVSDVGVALLG
jgi:hypothetical protein